MISCTLVGNLGSDAVTRHAGNTPVVSFRVASTEKNKSGDVTTWVRVDAFGDRFSKIIGYLVKGKQVAVRGSMSSREYQAKDGTTKTSLELKADDIQLLGGKSGSTGARHESRLDSDEDPLPF